MLSGNQKKSKSDLEILGDFILSVARECIVWHENVERTQIKNLLLQVIRKELPSNIKQAIINSDIRPDKYTTLAELQNKIIDIKFEEKSYSVPFPHLSKFFWNKKMRSLFHKDGTFLSSKEQAERHAKTASLVQVGNCNECRDLCEIIALECSPEVLKELDLPQFSGEMPCIEQVEYEEKEKYLFERDHCFNILGRPLTSSPWNIKSWIENGKDVVIVDFWKNKYRSVSVREQLSLPEEEQRPLFRALENMLSQGEKLKVISRREVGEGHSSYWVEKGRSFTYFIEKKYPSGTFFDSKTYAPIKKKGAEHDHRYRPY